ncbi:NEAT domain-containing protein [Paenibacillus qinlingensis]|uniref:NEAT domain-containing protein n=1 Tax=Paenibacillus qinlingensis TaxID=1837343 RepID=UPI00156725AB|nr:NEAT domain-containing protein [Paenibacillus qinlingensis]NQX59835.1 NEAT domain-containing protein [Paenibacillus qinlingensis]
MIKKMTILMLIVGLIFSPLGLHASTAHAAAAATTAPDGVYTVDYLYLVNELDSVSVANTYLKSPGQKGTLRIQNGKAVFEHEVSETNYSYFPYLGYRLDGKDKAVISTDPATHNEVALGIEGYQGVTAVRGNGEHANYLVTYNVSDITKKQDILMHVNIPDFNYNHWYNVQLKIDLTTVPGLPSDEEEETPGNGTVTTATYAQVFERITVAQSVYSVAMEGTNYGDYPTGSKSTLYAIIVSSQMMLDMTTQGDAAAYGQIYNTVNGALSFFESRRILADRSDIEPIIKVVQSFLNRAKRHGTAEGAPGSAAAAIQAGEYYASAINLLNSSLTTAKNAVANPKSTPLVLSNAKKAMENRYKTAEENEYVESKPYKIYALDTDQPTTTLSPYANEIGDTVTTIVQKVDFVKMINFLANVTLKVAPDDNQLLQSAATEEGPFYAYTFPAGQVSALSNASQKVYQLAPVSYVEPDGTWLGISMVKYTVEGVTRTVYISYNKEKLELLQTLVAQAEQLIAAPRSVGTSQEEFDIVKLALQASLDAAKPVASNLASKRPDIRTAHTALQAAVDSFRAVQGYERQFSTVHATKAAFSSADSYLGKPAIITSENGSTYAAVTLKDNTVIKSFQVKTGNDYVDAQVVSENLEANTRVVKFKIDSLSTLADAKMRVVIPAQNYDQTHTIRLNFNDVNNAELAQISTEASTLLRTAVVGTEVGQYPATAKTTLQAAIDTAGGEAVRTDGTNEQSVAALQTLKGAIVTFKASAVGTNPGTGGSQLDDGEYAIPFHIYKKGSNESSVMYDYVDTNSGKLIVENGQSFISFTLKQHAEILSFKTERNGSLVETDKVSENTAANTRVVRFPVKDLSARLNGWVKIYWMLPPPINLYDHEYEVELGFDQPVIPEVQQDLSFSVLHATKDEASSMDRYFVKPGKYSMVNGKARVTLTLKDSTTVPSFKVEKNGVLTETTVLSTDTAANTRVIQFETADLTTLLNAQVHVSTSYNGQPYEMDHNIRLKLYATDKTSLNALVTQAQSKYDGAVEGTDAGKYPAIAKAAMLAAINTGKAVAANAAASQQTADAAVVALQKALHVFQASIILADANYTVTLPTSITDGSGTPINNYVTSEAKLEVSNGKQVMTLQLQTGVTLKKVQKKKADGTLEDVLPQVVAAAKRVNEVAILSTSGSSPSFSFEVDRTANYVVTLVGADQTERAFEIPFSQLEPAKVTPGTSGPGSGTGPVGPVNVHGISDGTYSIAYKFLKYNESSTSVMQDYVVTPGKLTVSGSWMYFEFVLKNSKEIPDFQIDNGNGLSAPDVSATDEAKNTRTYKFKVNNLDEKLHGWVDVNWPAMNYVHNYDVHLALNRSSLQAIASGSNPALSGGEKPFIDLYTPGEYEMAYALNVRGTSNKAEVDAYVKHPAKLVVKDGKTYVQLTVSNQEVKSLKVEQNSTLTDVEIISTNEKDNEKTVQFAISDAKTKVMALFTVQGKYTGEYAVEFVWDGSSVKPYKEPVKDVVPVKPPTTTASSFKDVEKHWAKAQIDRAIQLGLTNGYGDNTFRPDNLITRAEFAALLGRVLKLVPSTDELSFSDATDIPTWVKPQLGSIVKAGILNGYEDGTFRADRQITRAELAVIIARALHLQVDEKAQSSFADVESIPSWAQAEVAAVQKQGIIQGRGDNLFAPNDNATRAEAISLILALYSEAK